MRKVIGKHIVIKDIEEEVTVSGLVLSGQDAENMRYKKAKVIKAGTDVTGIEDGDKVYYDKRNAFTMLIEDESYTIIQERDVVVVV